MREYFFELPCDDGHKSFHQKARVRENARGEKLLFSYGTAVCKLDAGGNFVRLWDGYSATTQRHINSFIRFYGSRQQCGKAAWLKTPVERRPAL